jgi:hypothetical protein
MIIDRSLSAVANWWFEDRSYQVFPNNHQERHKLLKMSQSVAEILEKHKLLFPNKVILSGWLYYDPSLSKLTRQDYPDVTVYIPDEIGSQEIVTRTEEVLNGLEKHRPFFYPFEVDIVGFGIVFDEQGRECKQPNVTWLSAKTLDAHIVDVLTQSDAWLPYTLPGKPQPEIYEYNAPRLESALQEIQERLEVIPSINDHSEYSHIEGFRLSNFVDADGEIIPTAY